MSNESQDRQAVSDWVHRFPQPSRFDKMNKLSAQVIKKNIRELEEDRIDVLFKWKDSKVLQVDETIKISVEPIRVSPTPLNTIDNRVIIPMSYNALGQVLATRSPGITQNIFQSLPYKVKANDIQMVNEKDEPVSEYGMSGIVPLKHLIVEDIFANRPKVKKIARLVKSDKVKDKFKNYNSNEERVALGIVNDGFPLEWKDSQFIDAMEQTFTDFALDFTPGNSSLSSNGTVRVSWLLDDDELFQQDNIREDSEFSFLLDLYKEYDDMGKGAYFENNGYGVGSFKLLSYAHKTICNNGMCLHAHHPSIIAPHTSENTYIKSLIDMGLQTTDAMKELKIELPEPLDISHYLAHYDTLVDHLTKYYTIRVISGFKHFSDEIKRAIDVVVADWQAELWQICVKNGISKRRFEIMQQIAIEEPTLKLSAERIELDSKKSINPTSYMKVMDILTSSENYFGFGSDFSDSLFALSGNLMYRAEPYTKTLTIEQYNRYL